MAPNPNPSHGPSPKQACKAACKAHALTPTLPQTPAPAPNSQPLTRTQVLGESCGQLSAAKLLVLSFLCCYYNKNLWYAPTPTPTLALALALAPTSATTTCGAGACLLTPTPAPAPAPAPTRYRGLLRSSTGVGQVLRAPASMLRCSRSMLSLCPQPASRTAADAYPYPVAECQPLAPGAAPGAAPAPKPERAKQE